MHQEISSGALVFGYLRHGVKVRICPADDGSSRSGQAAGQSKLRNDLSVFVCKENTEGLKAWVSVDLSQHSHVIRRAGLLANKQSNLAVCQLISQHHRHRVVAFLQLLNSLDGVYASRFRTRLRRIWVAIKEQRELLSITVLAALQLRRRRKLPCGPEHVSLNASGGGKPSFSRSKLEVFTLHVSTAAIFWGRLLNAHRHTCLRCYGLLANCVCITLSAASGIRTFISTNTAVYKLTCIDII